MYTGDIDAAPGSVSQVRECTSRLLRFCKERNIPTVIIGHVTKEGNIAGPRMLEHMVDVVLYFEGERSYQFRILRSIKIVLAQHLKLVFLPWLKKACKNYPTLQLHYWQNGLMRKAAAQS